MKKGFSKKILQDAVQSAAQKPETFIQALDGTAIPDSISSWLAKLSLLKGLPFNYLVPDESMLPPESIKFFYVDPNWQQALIDGAFSLGRNLTNEATSMDVSRDTALTQNIADSMADYLGQNYVNKMKKITTPEVQTVTGFFIRSSVVKAYPKMGVNAYPSGHTPLNNDPQLLPILRYEQLGNSDVLICLIQGEAVQIDLQEAPEVLHLGIDDYSYDKNNNTVTATKSLKSFTVSGNTVSIPNEDPTPVQIGSTFRKNANEQRVINMSTLASTISQNENNIPINSAEMGFVMTEGVGTVSFTFNS